MRAGRATAACAQGSRTTVASITGAASSSGVVLPFRPGRRRASAASARNSAHPVRPTIASTAPITAAKVLGTVSGSAPDAAAGRASAACRSGALWRGADPRRLPHRWPLSAKATVAADMPGVALCEGFRMPAADGVRHTRAAGVRKPPKDETAMGSGWRWRGHYGDLAAAVEEVGCR